MKTTNIVGAAILLFAVTASAQVPFLFLDGSAETTPGKIGNGYRFSGNRILTIGKPQLPAPWSVCLWVRRFDDGGSAVLFADHDYGLHLATCCVSSPTPGFVPGQVGPTVFYKVNYTFGFTVPKNEWHHLTFVAETNRTFLYVDGVQKAQLAVSMPLPLLQIGRRTPEAPGADWLNADLDEIAVYRHALSSNDVARIFTRGGTPKPVLLTGRFSFVQGYRLILDGEPNASYQLETSTDLLQWTPLITLKTTSSPLVFTDPSATNYPSFRFYRAKQLP